MQKSCSNHQRQAQQSQGKRTRQDAVAKVHIVDKQCHLYKRIVFVLLYEKQKIAKWKALWDGYRDGKRGKLGERGQ